MNMHIHSQQDISIRTGYFKPGENVDNASKGTKFKNWLSKTFVGKLFKMNPPKVLCVRDTATGQHVATSITNARYGQFVKVDLSGDQPTSVRSFTPTSSAGKTLEERGSGAENVDRLHRNLGSDIELKTAKADITEGFSKEFWNRDQMTVALYSKMTSRLDKSGAPIHAFVVAMNPKDAGSCELKPLLTGIKDSIANGSLREGTRFQVAVQCGAHWTAIDAKIVGGEPQFFIMDAAQSSTTDLVIRIRDEFPTSTIYQYNDRDLYQIQFDDNSCSRFTFDQLSAMTREEDLFERLAEQAAEGKFRKIGRGADEFMVPANHLSPGTLRMLQSHTMMDKLDDASKDRISSPSKNITEYQQAVAHSEIDFDRGKVMNKMAEYKKEKISEKAIDFLDRMDLAHFNKMMEYRSGQGIFF